jgi:hypothetical protein
VKGVYEPIIPDDEGGLVSEELGIRLVLEHGDLMMYDLATGERVLSPEEAREEEERRATAAERRAREEKRRADEEKRRAEEEKRRAASAEQRAEEEKRRADEAERRLKALQEEMIRPRDTGRESEKK